MGRTVSFLLVLAACGALRGANDTGVVFRSDVSLVRVDAQVVDRDNRAVPGLRAQDFVLREGGRTQAIRNFLSEDMPVDVLLLLDVSRSMWPHLERISSAAHQALRELRETDRMGIMVFDRSTRVRLAFHGSRDEIERGLAALLKHESFDGGTDITRGLLDAADYVRREARPEARRAIVIMTDDRTERNRDEEAVGRALVRANAVLCALIAPDAMARYSGRQQGGGRGGHGGAWPGGGGGSVGMGGPLGGIIFGRRGPYGGRGPSNGGGGGQSSRTQSAGTAEIARESGGDSLTVDDASALETTLARLRQRYTLHFHLPEGVKPGEERNIEVALSDAAAARYPGAEVHYRRVYLAPNVADAGAVSRVGPSSPVAQASGARRRPAVNEPSGPMVVSQPDDAAPAPQGGWRKVKPGEQP